MKKLILLFLIPFTMIMADFTLTGQTLTPINEDGTTPVTTATTTYSTAGSAKTNWGFQPFTVPSDSVTVPAGGDIQEAINSMSQGGTVYLEEGIYPVSNLQFRTSNVVLKGAGRNKTILEVAKDKKAVFTHCNNFDGCVKNLILSDFKVDCGDTGDGITFAWGPSNLLFENIEIAQPSDGGIIVNNNNWKFNGRNITYRNIYIHDGKFHGITARFTKGVVIDNYRANNLNQAIDFSSVIYGEVSSVSIENTVWGGSKFPTNNYLYMHDIKIKGSHIQAIKLQEGTKYEPVSGKQHIHLEDIIIEDSGAGIRWVNMDTKLIKPVEELVIKNVKLINNHQNWDYINNVPVAPYGDLIDYIRMSGIETLHEYDDNIGIVSTAKSIKNRIPHHNTTPETDGVGWTTWGNPQ